LTILPHPWKSSNGAFRFYRNNIFRKCGNTVDIIPTNLRVSIEPLFELDKIKALRKQQRPPL